MCVCVQYTHTQTHIYIYTNIYVTFDILWLIDLTDLYIYKKKKKIFMHNPFWLIELNCSYLQRIGNLGEAHWKKRYGSLYLPLVTVKGVTVSDPHMLHSCPNRSCAIGWWENPRFGHRCSSGLAGNYLIFLRWKIELSFPSLKIEQHSLALVCSFWPF